MTMITLSKAFTTCILSYRWFLSHIHVQVQVISPPQSVGRLLHWVSIFRLIDEIILLSAIFPILLVPCWGLYGADNSH
jgi:hypothetical protein